MTDAPRDNNQIPVALGTSNADGSTPLPIRVDPTSHILQVSNGAGGSDLSGDEATRDDNGIPVLMGVSSDDGVTPVAIYMDSSTNTILIDKA